MHHANPPTLPTVPLAHPLAQAAERLGIGKTTLYKLIDAQQIRPIKIGKRIVVPESELKRYIRAQLGS